VTPKPKPDRTPRPTPIKTPRPTKVITPKPTNVVTPKPTPDRTPRPTVWQPPKTPKPTRSVTPKPTKPIKTPKPTRSVTPRPTKVVTPKPTMVKTPKPTTYISPKPTKPIKTPKPTKLITPKPTKPIKTPRPTVWQPPKTPRPTKLITPRPTNTPKPTKTPRPTVTYLQPTPRPTVGGGWGAPMPTAPNCVPEGATYFGNPALCANTEFVCAPSFEQWHDSDCGCGCKPIVVVPLRGCAASMAKNDCKGNEARLWKSGYPPMQFSSDSDYILIGEESFFANMDSNIVEIVNGMDTRLMIGIACLLIGIVVFAIRQYSMKNDKIVNVEETTGLLA